MNAARSLFFVIVAVLPPVGAAFQAQDADTSTSGGNGFGQAAAGGHHSLGLFSERPSVVLIVLDDIGTDQVAAHPNAIPDPPPTPTLSLMAAEGVQFTNVWGSPRCSPARASLLTGRFAHRTGIGDVVHPASAELADAEVTIAERVAARGYATALFGKWHLTMDPESTCAQGFSIWDGTQKNISSSDYWEWVRTMDTAAGPALVTTSYEYATTAVTDAALAWLGERAGEPYFCVVAYNAAHEPVHCPPVELQGECLDGNDPDLAQYRGLVESVDTEIARLLLGVDRATTTVIVVGDNGTPNDWTGIPYKSKSSAYRLGIEVPLIFWGMAVDDAGQWGIEDSGHVQIADLYRTILQLLPGKGDAGMQVLPLDSVSLYESGRFAASRAWNFTERFTPLGAPPGGPYTVLRRATEDSAGYKLIEDETGKQELYNTVADPDELYDLLADGTDPFEQAVLDGHQAVQQGLGLPQ